MLPVTFMNRTGVFVTNRCNEKRQVTDAMRRGRGLFSHLQLEIALLNNTGLEPKHTEN